ncbi:MAG: NapC/NirT family cytochrome c [Phycisphaerales bacterium]|nr:NapC/NirT family cytochrome c [Phycisphaerales bacterium]
MRRAFRWLWVKKWKRLVPIALVIFVVGNIALVELTSSSGFCNTCHIMGPYYDSWATGSHKNVACVKCHISPGASNFVAAKLNGLGQVVDDVLNRTSTKPSASVNVLSCTRSGCHTIETLNTKAIVTDRFKFRHDKHLGAHHLGVEISCSTCHSHVKGDQHFEVNTGVCITCHLIETAPIEIQLRATGTGQDLTPSIRMEVRPVIAEITAGLPAVSDASLMVTRPPTPPGAEPVPPNHCTACHDAPNTLVQYQGIEVNHSEFLSFGAACVSCHRSVTATPPAIEDGSCLVCHNFGVERVTDSIDMHRIHSLGRHKVECFNCHGTIKHGPAAQTMSLEQFDCSQCHIDQHSIQRSEYALAGATTGRPEEAINPMFLAHVDCNGCHISARELHSNPTSPARVHAATPEACNRCHQPGFGEKMVPLWQNATKALYAAAEKALAETEPLATSDEAKALVAQARGLINIVKVDGSWGVHNPTYTQSLLEQAQGKLAQARQAPEADRP